MGLRFKYVSSALMHFELSLTLVVPVAAVQYAKLIVITKCKSSLLCFACFFFLSSVCFYFTPRSRGLPHGAERGGQDERGTDQLQRVHRMGDLVGSDGSRRRLLSLRIADRKVVCTGGRTIWRPRLLLYDHGVFRSDSRMIRRLS